jgi:putative membrane protein
MAAAPKEKRYFAARKSGATSSASRESSPLANCPLILHFVEVKWFLQRWAVTTIGVLVASQLVPGIHYRGFEGLLVASLLLGVFNAVLRPVMMILSLPLLILTLGLFTFVINALLLRLVGALVQSFDVNGFWPALFGGIIISIVSFIANGLIGKKEKRPDASAPPPPSRRPPPPPGTGPVIDV